MKSGDYLNDKTGNKMEELTYDDIMAEEQYDKDIEEHKRCQECGSKDLNTRICGDGDGWVITCNKCNNLVDED